MKTHHMKIREKFLPEILSGTKKHEYRLASPDKMQVKIGDIFVLISNQNKQKFVKVTVKEITYYRTWEEALNENWHRDFKNIYTSMQEALTDCYKFYTKQEVDIYGLVVFSVEPLKAVNNIAAILLDTDIIIKRETNNSYVIENLFKWFSKQSIPAYIHPATIGELASSEGKKKKAIKLTKLDEYRILSESAHDVDIFFDKIVAQYPMEVNGKTDNILLQEVYDGNVDLLLSDAELILHKAEELYIRDKVFTSIELLKYFEDKYPQNIEYKMLAVKLKDFDEVDLHSDFFDSLREDYGNIKFDDWFKKKGLEKEEAYVFENSFGLKGFLYLKHEGEDEDYSDIRPVFQPKRRLKVGTFKIDSTGFRLGERFLKIIFDNAHKYDADEIYVTLFENRRDDITRLKDLMEQWGFIRHGYKNTGEVVLVKALKHYNESKDPMFNYPLCKKNVSYFFLPIYPKYHTDLFPDKILRNEDMHLYEDNKAHRYAIKKIYLTGAYNIQANPGDLVLIYRMGERIPKKYSSVVTGLAIVDDVIHTHDVEECIKICKNRSIFSVDEIKEIYNKYPTVIKLLDYIAFENKVTLNELYNANIIQAFSGPRPFDSLTKEQFNIIYKLGMEKK